MKFIFTKLNLILFLTAIAFLIIGYGIMGTGDATISPVILIISYVILFPAALLAGTLKKKKDKNE